MTTTMTETENQRQERLKAEQILAIQDMTHHSYPTQSIPLNAKDRHIKYARLSRKSGINTNFKEKAALAARDGIHYDEQADRAYQERLLEQHLAYKAQRTATLRANIQERFNTPPEHLQRALQARALQDSKKQKEKLDNIAKRQAKSRARKALFAPDSIKTNDRQVTARKLPTLVAS